MKRWAFGLLLLTTFGCRAPREIDDVVYDSRYGDDTKLDLYLPDDGDTHPAVMLIHGGAWRFGSKREFKNTGRRLARSGYVAASINYRLVPEGEFPAAFQDVACALAFLQGNAAEYDIDPNAIAVMGYSAGGHLTSLLGVAWDEADLAPDCDAGSPSAPGAVIPGAAAHDLVARSDKKWVREFVGGSRDELPERYAQASPIRHVGPGEAPYLLIIGGGDWIGTPDQSWDMRAKLKENGNDVRILELAGGGHLLQPSADPGELEVTTLVDTPEAWLVLGDFLERTIGPP